ncbi:MAG: DUF2333 family protein [Thermodesulfobacteriota bacterium]|nr:DUF2333 family protein [Thermodesulfobacteriota bacterium]
MKDLIKEKGLRKTKFYILGCLLALFVFVPGVMVYESKKPDHIILSKLDSHVKGAAFIRINQALIEQMYKNWLPNDILWPTVLLDNMPNFQLGELEVVRYNLRVLRDNLSRMRTTDKLDPLAEEAFTSVSNDAKKWWLPSAEDKWKQSYKNLEAFYQNLSSGKSNFYIRADNLVELLSQYASLMGGANTRLINAPRDIERAPDLDEEIKESPENPQMVAVHVDWHRIDDNFYYTQGVAYALHESFKAVRTDFVDVLNDKNSVELVDKIIENLKRCHFEPLIVFNGDPESIFANHSLNLSGVFNDARQKVNSLIVALMQG